jgi:hypothetical protein
MFRRMLAAQIDTELSEEAGAAQSRASGRVSGLHLSRQLACSKASEFRPRRRWGLAAASCCL